VVKFSKRIDYFIEDYISKDIDATLRYVKALEPLMLAAIPKKNTLFRPKIKFVFVIGTEIRPTRAPKHT
jgi:hypothetical protein